MSKVILFTLLLACLAINACGNSNQINGHSLSTAHKSINLIKQRLPESQRVELEIAYWLLRKQFKDDAEFLKAVDQKYAAALIEQAKDLFAANRTAGKAETGQYQSWEQMLAAQIDQRNQQALGASDPKDRKDYPRVDYKLRSM